MVTMTVRPEEFRPQTPELCLPPALRKPRLRRWEASEYLEMVHGVCYAPATLAKLASIGGGPMYQKANNTPLYARDELDAWALARLGKPRRSTSDTGE